MNGNKQVLMRGLSDIVQSPKGNGNVYTRFTLRNTSLSSIDFLCTYPYLQFLDLSRNCISDCSSLSSLPFLTHIDLSSNKLSTALDFLPPHNLIEADLSRNQIAKINDLSKHRYLQKLCLDQNLIKDIKGLTNLCYLSHLSLATNGISRIEGLESLSLKYLDLRRNRIRSLEGLQTLVSLQTLLLSYNEIEIVLPLIVLPRLKSLDLEKNMIRNFDQIVALQKIRSLVDVKLKKNVIAIDPEYRSKTVFTLQQINVLDGMVVKAEEKVRACNLYAPPEEVVQSMNHAKELKQTCTEYSKIKAYDLAKKTSLRPIVLCGPKGAGKRTLISFLLKQYPQLFGLCVSHTTRKPRLGEENGVHYHFVSREAMEGMIQQNKFIEVVNLFGNLYGNSMEAIEKVAQDGKICLLHIEVEGVVALQNSHLTPRYIFITTPSLDVLQSRLQDPSQVNNKLIQQWLAKSPNSPYVSDPEFFDAVIVNNDIHSAFQHLKGIVLGHYWDTYDEANACLEPFIPQSIATTRESIAQ